MKEMEEADSAGLTSQPDPPRQPVKWPMRNRLVRPNQEPPSDSESRPLGRWGQMYLASLSRNDPAQQAELESSGELDKVARQKDEMAEAEYRGTLDSLMKSEPPAEGYVDRQAQIQRMKRTAEEVAEQNVRVPDPEWEAQNRDGLTDENTAHWSEEPLLPKPPTSP